MSRRRLGIRTAADRRRYDGWMPYPLWADADGLAAVRVLHFFTDDDQVRRIVGPLAGALPRGSDVTISHATSEFGSATVEAGRAHI